MHVIGLNAQLDNFLNDTATINIKIQFTIEKK